MRDRAENPRGRPHRPISAVPLQRCGSSAIRSNGASLRRNRGHEGEEGNHSTYDEVSPPPQKGEGRMPPSKAQVEAALGPRRQSNSPLRIAAAWRSKARTPTTSGRPSCVPRHLPHASLLRFSPPLKKTPTPRIELNMAIPPAQRQKRNRANLHKIVSMSGLAPLSSNHHAANRGFFSAASGDSPDRPARVTGAQDDATGLPLESYIRNANRGPPAQALHPLHPRERALRSTPSPSR